MATWKKMPEKRREALITSLNYRYRKAIANLDSQATTELFKEAVYLGISIDELGFDK
tara:strand:- start:484 stop:654 length:171 start_codon:yes stop_codon:yes gene_type:complete